ncbi:50S ribosomal protein L11 [Candidatus Mycoplasma haematohominis]|uniref:Large ribosomal subunit protein uL11 n=1 Tax=Candidatus Mycoplasma haematohominis TaxID=1494318 RepID=A0A478FSI0_9MOLU|nr:50S ribosomal protein L11 [Candidatus Mycoplasma haemohominis]GCE63035.1 50S ribosomal protein L11 [Candidatus Mycoplasma haemohominis]
MAEVKRPKKRVAKLELIGGQAKPGPALASLGINMGQFTKDFNEKTKERNGEVIPVVFTILPNKSFTFELKTTPVPILLKKALNIEKGASNQKTPIGKLSRAKLREMAEYKMKDTNAASIEAMEKMIIGTAKQMGIELENE